MIQYNFRLVIIVLSMVFTILSLTATIEARRFLLSPFVKGSCSLDCGYCLQMSADSAGKPEHEDKKT